MRSKRSHSHNNTRRDDGGFAYVAEDNFTSHVHSGCDTPGSFASFVSIATYTSQFKDLDMVGLDRVCADSISNEELDAIQALLIHLKNAR